MEYIFLIIFFVFFNLLIFLNFEALQKKLVFVDKPDQKLKKHKNPVSLLGGLILLINFYLIIFILKIFNLNDLIFNTQFIYIIIFLSTLFYLVGFIDDLKNLTPNLKLLLICLSFVFVTFLFPEIKLKYIRISFLEKTYYFNNFSAIFLILSFALLSNALNMFDGINLQLICFSAFIFIIFILNNYFPIFFILILICLSFLGILNYKNKLFLGDGGCYLLSSIIGCTFIYQYKYFENFLYGDQIFIILLIPSIDMLRLFIVRTIKKKNPFKGDFDHLHHIVNNYFKNNNYTVIFTILMCIFPSMMLFFDLKTYYILIISIVVYTSSIIYLKSKT